MLQFITNQDSKLPVKDQILQVLDGGCRWIQIRMKEATDDEIKKLFFEIRDKAKDVDATIIIDDKVDLVKQLGPEGVAGVHLGKGDMAPAEARLKLGPDAIIGVTANTFMDIETVRHLDIDYVGIGPFALTNTKKNLAPILGIEGIAEIMRQVKDAGIELPCVAVGGIRLEDVKPLLDAGINGLAVSGAIANAGNPAEAVKDFLKQLPVNE